MAADVHVYESPDSGVVVEVWGSTKTAKEAVELLKPGLPTGIKLRVCLMDSPPGGEQ